VVQWTARFSFTPHRPGVHIPKKVTAWQTRVECHVHTLLPLDWGHVPDTYNLLSWPAHALAPFAFKWVQKPRAADDMLYHHATSFLQKTLCYRLRMNKNNVGSTFSQTARLGSHLIRHSTYAYLAT
jgi:hypothetical protein